MLFICGISGYAQQLKIQYKDSTASINRRAQRAEERNDINVGRSMSATFLNKRDSLRNLREKQPSQLNIQNSSMSISRRTKVDSTKAANSDKRR